MEHLRNTNPRRLIFFAVLLLLLSTALFFWMRPVVNELFVLPISYVFYLAGIFISITPQMFFWLALLLITFWIAFRSLNRKPRLDDLSKAYSARAVEDTPTSGGRLTFWTVKVNVLKEYRSSYFIGGFHQALARLVLDMLAHRYRLTMPQVEARVRARDLELPEDVQEYLLFCLSRPEISNVGRLQRLWQELLDAVFQRLHLPAPQMNAQSPAARAFARVARVIQYMEDELEVSHEHPSQ
jgi:hypothetical protein